MKVSKPEVKTVIWDIITLEEQVDNNGAFVPRKAYPKNALRGITQLKNQLLEVTEVAMAEKKKTDSEGKDISIPREKLTDSDLEWVKFDVFKKNEDQNKYAIATRYTEEEVEFTPKMIDALKWAYKDRDLLPVCTEEAMDAIEALIK